MDSKNEKEKKKRTTNQSGAEVKKTRSVKNKKEKEEKVTKKIELEEEEKTSNEEVIADEKVIIKKEGFNLLEVILIMFITLVFGTFLGSALMMTKSNKTTESTCENELPSELKEFVTTYEDIVKNYYEEVDKDKLLNAGLEGMLDFLEDKYSVYMDKDESDAFSQEVEGKYMGIGTEIAVKYLDAVGENGTNTHQIIISDPFEGGPADKVGLKAGDIILKVNDEDISELTVTQVAAKVKGKTGTTVKLTIQREEEVMDFVITRGDVEITSVTSNTFDVNGKKIGYLKIDIFAANTTSQFEKALIKLEDNNIDSLVIDVRDNSGGYLTTVTDIASMFLDKSKIVYQLDTKGIIESVYSKTSKSRSYPVAVLINGYSASASEILAEAMLESYGAEIVGVSSFGKGTVQKAYQLESGATIKYTIQKWLTPNGNWINEKGVTPTVEIELDDKYYDTFDSKDDNQLQKALEVLSEK